MLGLGLRWRISSLSSGCRWKSELRTPRSASLSSVSSSRGTVRGFPVRFDLDLLIDLGVVVGRRALESAGDVDMGSSSGPGEGEAFRFREEERVDTAASQLHL